MNQQLTKYVSLSLAVIIVSIIASSLVVQAAENDDNFQDTRTADEWTEAFRCKTEVQADESTQRRRRFRWSPAGVWRRIMDASCNRDTFSWRFKYVDELRKQGKIFVKDATIDERLANIIQSLNIHNFFDTRYSYFNSGDARRDARNELEVAGPEVDDAKCARDLARMSELFDELQARLNQTRAAGANSTFEARHIQLARVLDSFGRYESGSLEGRTRLVGDYDECEGSQLLLTTDATDKENVSSETSIKLRYCWVNLNIDRNLHSVLRHRKPFEHESALANLNAGVCLPRSCHSKNFHRHARKKLVQKLVDSQLGLPASIYVHNTYELESVFCLVDPDSEYGKLPLSGKLCLLATGCWVLLCIALTFLNKHTQARQEKGRLDFLQRLTQHLDLAQSWRELTSDKRESICHERPVDLDALNPIKLFACAFCVVTHTAFLLGTMSGGLVRIAFRVDSNNTLQWALLSTTIVDTFFVISGILITYTNLKKLYKASSQRISTVAAAASSLVVKSSDNVCRKYEILNTRCNADVEQKNGGGSSSIKDGFSSFMSQWFEMALSRYLRIVPLYAILLWFRRDVLMYLGWGPLWDYGLNKETPNGACAQEAWWMPFTFWSASIRLTKQCYLPSWSLSNDILFGLMIPPILILYTKRPRLALGGTITLILVFIAITIEAFLSAPVGMWELLEYRFTGFMHYFNGLSYLYTWPFFRAPCFLIGSLAGYYLFRYESEVLNKQKEKTRCTPGVAASSANHWPRWFTGFATQLCWLYLAAHMIVGYFSNELREISGPYMRLVLFYWLVLDRSVWSVVNAIIFMRMATDWRASSAIIRAFASQRWRSLTKLNFPLVFIHWLVLLVFLGFLPTPASFTMWQIFAAFSAVATLSIPIATLVHVIFENPIDKLIRREIFSS